MAFRMQVVVGLYYYVNYVNDWMVICMLNTTQMMICGSFHANGLGHAYAAYINKLFVYQVCAMCHTYN